MKIILLLLFSNILLLANFANDYNCKDIANKDKTQQKQINPQKFEDAYKTYVKKLPTTQQEIKKLNHYAMLAIENKTNPHVSCETIKATDTQFNFTLKQSYKIYKANKSHKCDFIKDKNFDYLITPLSAFLSKCISSHSYLNKGLMVEVLESALEEYAQKAIKNTLDKSYKYFDDRWVFLSRCAMSLAIIKNDKKYLKLASDIIKATPLNKNRYYRYNLKKNYQKIYFYNEKREKIIKENLVKISQIYKQL